MADYVVHFTGKNDLSSEVTKVKKDLEGVSTSANKLDQIKNKFNKITSSAAPLKKQMKDIKDLMAQMNFHGLENDSSYTKMAEKIGEIRDAYDAAGESQRFFGDGQYKLQAVMNSLEAVAGATSIATGAMSLFGAENENVARAIQKVQSVMAILNGVQAIANVLDKDSAMMLRIRQIRTLALAAAKDVDTAETTKNTLATGANTVATTANTIAQKAWNVAKAVAKALLGDWTGLLLVGAVALGGYAIATANSTKETEKETEATKRAKTAKQQYLEEVASSTGKLIGQYKVLQIQWNNLKTDGEKTEWIKDNASKFNELGISINNVAKAEDVFVKKTEKFQQAIKLRAQAAAAYSQIVKVWEEYYNKVVAADNSVAGGGYYTRAQVGHQTTGRELTAAYSKYAYIKPLKEWENNPDKLFTIRTENIAPLNALRNSEAISKNQKQNAAALEKATNATDFLTQSMSYANEELKRLGTTVEGTTDNISNRATITTSTNDNVSKIDNSYIQKQILKSIDERDFSNDLSMESAAKLLLANAKLAPTNIKYKSDEQLLELEKIQKTYRGEIDKFIRGIIDIDQRIKAFNNAGEALKRIGLNDVSLDFGNGDIISIKSTYIDKVNAAREAIQGLSGDYGILYNQIDTINALLNSSSKNSDGDLVPNVNDRNVGTIAATALATQQLGSALQALGAQGAAAKAGLILSAIGQLATSFAAAMLSASKNWITWLAFGATGMGILVSLISQMKSFADGGIIEGNSFHGDKILARVNAGEMILNQKQQSNLYHQLNNRGGLGAGTVKFEIAGSTLKGVLRNYDNKMSKVQ